jgi:hypothetical protein
MAAMRLNVKRMTKGYMDPTHNTYRIPGHTISFICIRNLHTITLKSQIDTCYSYVLRTVVKYCYIKMEILLKKNTTL